jgi:uncharacterized membrane protein YuzA (DUF378 family)
MKAYRTTIALVAAGVEGVFGFAVVAAILGFAAIDYRLGGRVFGK